ncbi:MAG: hypothetical protein AAFY76_05585, partial [Cyanobacteria bacterium J06649_11]
ARIPKDCFLQGGKYQPNQAPCMVPPRNNQGDNQLGLWTILMSKREFVQQINLSVKLSTLRRVFRRIASCDEKVVDIHVDK